LLLLNQFYVYVYVYVVVQTTSAAETEICRKIEGETFNIDSNGNDDGDTYCMNLEPKP